MNQKVMAFKEHTLAKIEPILEGMPGGLFMYRADETEELLYTNSAVLRIFGCETEEEFRTLTGYTFKGMVHPEDLDEVEQSIQIQIANSIYDFDYVEYRIIQKDGTIRWIEDYGHFMHTEMFGDIFYVFIDDSTERLKNRMSELEKMNEELRSIYARETQYRKAILYDAISRNEKSQPGCARSSVSSQSRPLNACASIRPDGESARVGRTLNVPLAPGSTKRL